jgi:hypothetical protein
VLAAAENRRLGQDVVPERRALQEPAILERLDLLLVRRSLPDLLGVSTGMSRTPCSLQFPKSMRATTSSRTFAAGG